MKCYGVTRSGDLRTMWWIDISTSINRLVPIVVGGNSGGESIIELARGLSPPAIYRHDVCAILYEYRVIYVCKSLKL